MDRFCSSFVAFPRVCLSSFRLDDEIHVRMILDLEKVLPTVKFVSLILISVYLLHLNNFQIEIYTNVEITVKNVRIDDSKKIPR